MAAIQFSGGATTAEFRTIFHTNVGEYRQSINLRLSKHLHVNSHKKYAQLRVKFHISPTKSMKFPGTSYPRRGGHRMLDAIHFRHSSCMAQAATSSLVSTRLPIASALHS